MLQVLQDKHPEPHQVATTLEPPMAEGSTAVGHPLVVVMEEDLPQEGLMDHLLVEDPMDTPMLGDSPLELQEVLMVAQLQEVPMDSLLQIPMEPSILGLMDRALLQVSRGRDFRPLTWFAVVLASMSALLWLCRQPPPGPLHVVFTSAHISRMGCWLCCGNHTLRSLWLTVKIYSFACLLLLACQQLGIWCDVLLHMSFLSSL